MIKKVLGLIFNAWVLAIVGLIAIALVIWLVGPMVQIGRVVPLESETARYVLIGAIVLLYVLAKLWGAWRARRTNTAVVNQLIAQAPTAGAPDAASAELATIRERFEQALTTLKQARFQGQRGLWASASAHVGKRFLYELPWYVIIGAPGSGKTTALLNSGLEFPLAASMGDAAIRGVGGTRNCDWWFTTEAVLIDTAGRYTTQDSDRDVDRKAWSGFLGLIKSSRPRQPLNGVLVTVSVADLLTRTAPERAKQAAAVRARVQELHQELGIRFPIYLLVTKCDLLAGFVDYLGDASKEQRQDPWGFTFALDAQQRTDIAALPGEFDLLEKRLTDGLIDRLQSERDPARRARIYAFPQQFAGLRGVLQEFVEKVFSPSQFEERPLLRGAYFISGTQEGTPIDRMLGTIARTYRLARTPPPALQASGKSYFLSRLLHEVVFAEASLAGTNLKWERRRSILAWSGYAAIALVFAGVATAWGVSYYNNRKYVADVASRVTAVRELVQATPNRASSDLSVLLPALAATKALAVEEKQSVPWSLGFGLYQGRKLDSATQQVYKRMLVDAVQPRLALRVEDQLRRTGDDPELQYEVLKTYVMLHDPEHFDKDALKSYVMADWQVNLSRDISTDDRAALEAHLDALLAQGATVSPLPEDKQLVEQTRRVLAQMPLAQRIYSRIKRDGVGADIPEFTIAKAAGSGGPLVFTRAGKDKSLTRGVPGLYTYDGYYRGFQKVVDDTTKQLRDEEGWVLGLNEPSRIATLRDPQALARLTNEVRRAYLLDYVKQWEAFIADIKLVPMTGLTQAMQAARILSAPDNPLVPLMRGIVKETTLTEVESKSVVDKAQDTARQKIDESREKLARMLGTKSEPSAVAPGTRIESIVDARFESLRQFVKAPPAGGVAPIDATVGLLNEVYLLLSATDTAVKGGNAPPPSDVPNKVKAESGRLPEPVRTLVSTLSATSNAAATGAARANLSSSVNSSIGEFCRQAIPGRYPFTPSSTTDVTQDDFGRLFSPGGLFDEFFQKNLAALVDTNTRPWTFRQLGEGAITRDSATLAQFQRAAMIRDTFFRSGGKVASLRLDFKPQEMDATITQFTLDVDGQLIKYGHGPQIPTSIQWPGPKGSAQVRLQLQPALASGSSGMTSEGPWALFRMFDKLQIAPSTSPEKFKVTFNVDNRRATFEVTTSSVVNPFQLRELREFNCPRSL